jgi:hypothetical protein
MFPPNAFSIPTDCVLLSSDQTYFFLSSKILFSQSSNAFMGLLWSPDTTFLPRPKCAPDTAFILNILLLSIYGVSCSQFDPSFEQLDTAINRLCAYGVSPSELITKNHPLFGLLLTHASFTPLDVYALAASHLLEDLAVASSSHLLSLRLSTITDEVCLKIGAVYLKRLVDLHLDRMDALRAALIVLPDYHQPTVLCQFTGDGETQSRMRTAWARGVADLTWELRPDISVNMLRLKLTPIAEQLSCPLCRTSVQKRIDELCTRWAVVKVSFSVCLGASF